MPARRASRSPAARCGARVAAAPPDAGGTLFLAGRDPGTLTASTPRPAASRTRVPRSSAAATRRTSSHFTGGRLVTFALGRASSFAPDLSDPRALGESWFFVPSATPGRVWNILLDAGDSNVHFRGVREVTVDGQLTFARHAGGARVAAGRRRRRAAAPAHGLEVWDPRTASSCAACRARSRSASAATLVASCGDPCDRLYSSTTGARAAGRSTSPAQGAFSPDGALLAVPAPSSGCGRRRRARRRSRRSRARAPTRLPGADLGVERLAVLQRGRAGSSARGGRASRARLLGATSASSWTWRAD